MYILLLLLSDGMGPKTKTEKEKKITAAVLFFFLGNCTYWILGSWYLLLIHTCTFMLLIRNSWSTSQAKSFLVFYQFQLLFLSFFFFLFWINGTKRQFHLLIRTKRIYKNNIKSYPPKNLLFCSLILEHLFSDPYILLRLI